MPQHFSQITLVSSICSALEAQALERGEKAVVSAHQLNVICSAASSIVAAMAVDDEQVKAGIGLQAWLASDDTGISGLTMAAALYLAGKYAFTPQRWCHPWDPSDFGRCHRFLEAVPGSRERLPEMKTVSPVWATLVDNWDEITRLYLEELPTGKAPKCYALMDKLIEATRHL